MTNVPPEGLLLLDKPAGMTSHDCVDAVRRSYGERSVGHLGTLDPFATGLLVVLVGRATRLANFIDAEPKTYDATIAFGTETDTDDLTGIATRTAPPPEAAAVGAAIERLTGEIEQVPPDYSAKQVGGRRAHSAARAGAPLALKSVRVRVHEWRIRSLDADRLDATIVCGGGTYVRALARDLGRASNSAAHLTMLRRTRVGQFDVRDATTVEQLRTSPPRLRRLRVTADV
jgi:tRNA pseudouridine55 synthase